MTAYSYLAWARNFEIKLETEITFPTIANLRKGVARLYGTLMPGESKTETSRCVFVIDGKQIAQLSIIF